jgi:two-component system LytT family response regulator
MPPANSFELLKRFKDIYFEIIFTTAFGDYAIEAIKQSPVDYLLKPIDPDELYDAIQKVKKKIYSYRAMPGEEKKLLLHTDKSFLIVSINEIVRIESEEKRTAFTMKNKTVHRTSKGITDYENVLRSRKFFRTHRSHIINMDEVKEYIPEKNGGCVVMSDGKLIPLAIRRKDDFLLYFVDSQA